MNTIAVELFQQGRWQLQVIECDIFNSTLVTHDSKVYSSLFWRKPQKTYKRSQLCIKARATQSTKPIKAMATPPRNAKIKAARANGYVSPFDGKVEIVHHATGIIAGKFRDMDSNEAFKMLATHKGTRLVRDGRGVWLVTANPIDNKTNNGDK